VKVNRSNSVTIELDEGDTVYELFDAIGGLPQGAKVSWIPLGHNRPALYVKLPTDD
jgi:hypothetical protein